ncbi:3-oxoacyl-[acyl-carrier-protein] synthase III C-terminal domain-containing protein [Streptomyces armeniacus]|uniref:3-oxoacyl-[acyl-carrier-protein] synthase III C-terminal domain-containing protein n=1 Tax=Streptomyces armeniacus TaxID=83291 RepID=UPI001FE41783|nr:3-oxoacyl-[acyl-carrier-protein] synthase III C-terminal domain-containing protein [Streptomyces armeniacus]
MTTPEIIDDISARHGAHAKLRTIQRVLGRIGVDTRRMTRPLTDRTVSGDARITDRNATAYQDALGQAVRAANGALSDSGLTPHSVDALVTSHTTSWTCPGLDVDLINEIGLRPTVTRIPLSTLGCAGGAHALVTAADHVAAHPGHTVLVVVAETLSTVYNHRDTSVESMIYKALFGDSAAATLVSGRPYGPGFTIEATWEYVLPHSTDRYKGRLDGDGLHFDSDSKAVGAVAEIMPELRRWLTETGHGTHPPQWAAVHAGGPRILTAAAEGLGLADTDLRHSWNSLREYGNLGGASVLDVLARTHTQPPADGAKGVLLAFGPGFVGAAAAGEFRTGQAGPGRDIGGRTAGTDTLGP